MADNVVRFRRPEKKPEPPRRPPPRRPQTDGQVPAPAWLSWAAWGAIVAISALVTVLQTGLPFG